VSERIRLGRRRTPEIGSMRERELVGFVTALPRHVSHQARHLVRPPFSIRRDGTMRMFAQAQRADKKRPPATYNDWRPSSGPSFLGARFRNPRGPGRDRRQSDLRNTRALTQAVRGWATPSIHRSRLQDAVGHPCAGHSWMFLRRRRVVRRCGADSGCVTPRRTGFIPSSLAPSIGEAYVGHLVARQAAFPEKSPGGC